MIALNESLLAPHTPHHPSVWPFTDILPPRKEQKLSGSAELPRSVPLLPRHGTMFPLNQESSPSHQCPPPPMEWHSAPSEPGEQPSPSVPLLPQHGTESSLPACPFVFLSVSSVRRKHHSSGGCHKSYASPCLSVPPPPRIDREQLLALPLNLPSNF